MKPGHRIIDYWNVIFISVKNKKNGAKLKLIQPQRHEGTKRDVIKELRIEELKVTTSFNSEFLNS